MQRRTYSIAACYILIFVCAVIMTVISPLITEMSKEFSLNLVESGALFTAMFIGYTVFTLIGGVLADRFGKKRVLITCLIILCASLFAFSLAANYITSCILILLAGGGAGIMECMTNALIAEISLPSRKSFHLNFIQVIFGIGAFTGPFLTGFCLSSGISWRTIYIFIAILTAGLILTSAFIKSNKADIQEKLSPAAFKTLFTDARFIMLCICLFLYTGSETGAWGWMSTFLEANLAFNIYDSGLAVGVFWMAVVFARIVIITLMKKVSMRTFIIILSFASAAVTLGSAFVTSREMGWAVVIMLGLCYSSIWPLIVSYASERYTRHTGTVFASLVASGGLGMCIIPLSIGAVGQHTNIRTAMALPAILFLAIGLIFIFIERIKNRSTTYGEK